MIADAMLFQWPLVASFSHHSVMTSRFKQSTSATQLCLQGIGNENTGGVSAENACQICMLGNRRLCVCVSGRQLCVVRGVLFVHTNVWK